MPRFVALLRGVNVGKANRVPMADWRELLAQLGYTQVATLLNSGNATFSAARGTAASHASAIARLLAERLQVKVPVVVKSARDLARVVADNPFVVAAAEHPRLLVALAQDTDALAALAAIGALVVPPERFFVGRAAAYLYCTRGLLDSKAASALLGKRGRAVTTRNWATVLKLQALVEAGGV